MKPTTLDTIFRSFVDHDVVETVIKMLTGLSVGESFVDHGGIETLLGITAMQKLLGSLVDHGGIETQKSESPHQFVNGPSSTMVVLKPIKGSYTADIAKSQKTSKSTGRLYSALEGLRFSVDLPGFSGYLRSTPMAELFV